MSVASLFLQSVDWVLTSLDYPGHILTGQFSPTDLTEDISANYAELATLGREQPILQYQRGELIKIRFGAMIWAEHQGIFGLGADDIEDTVFEVRRLPQRDIDLKRPEIFDLTIGDTDNLHMTCVVKSVGGVRYDRLRPLDGSLRGVRFNIECWRYDPFDQDLTGSANESLVVTRKSNESFELMARKVYGSAAVGEPLRRRNPKKVVLETGDLIRFPPKANLTVGFVLEPASTAMKPTDRQLATRRDFFDLRSRPFVSHILGIDWENS